MRKSLSMLLLLTIMLIISISSSALATNETYDEDVIEEIAINTNDNDIMPLRYGIISTVGAYLYIDNNTAFCTGSVVTQEIVASIQITMTLQKYSGGDWITYAQWSKTAYNTQDFDLQKNTSVDNGSYRLYVSAKATPYEGNQETQSAISDVKP